MRLAVLVWIWFEYGYIWFLLYSYRCISLQMPWEGTSSFSFAEIIRYVGLVADNDQELEWKIAWMASWTKIREKIKHVAALFCFVLFLRKKPTLAYQHNAHRHIHIVLYKQGYNVHIHASMHLQQTHTLTLSKHQYCGTSCSLLQTSQETNVAYC